MGDNGWGFQTSGRGDTDTNIVMTIVPDPELGTKRTDLRDDPSAENRPFDCSDPPEQTVEKLDI
jgi:hypothetical protein